MALARRVSRSPVADLPPAQCADAEGPDLRADGGDVRRGDDVAAGDAGRRAQLGLPLQLDPRLGLHALGPSLARLRPGGRRLLLLHRGRRLRRPGPAGPLRDRRRARDRGAASSRTSRATRPRSRCASATRLTTRTSTTSGARCWTRSTSTRRPATSCPRARGRSCTRQVEQAIAHWRERDRGIWEVRGEPQHFTSSKVFCWLACDRGARLARLRGDLGQAERWQTVADEIREDVLANGVDPRRTASSSTTRRRRSTPRCCCCR